jgi:hypothetical protein
MIEVKIGAATVTRMRRAMGQFFERTRSKRQLQNHR